MILLRKVLNMIKLIKNIFKFEYGVALIIVATLWGMAFPIGIGYVYLLLIFYFVLLLTRGVFTLNINYFTGTFFLCILVYILAVLINPNVLLDYRVVKSDLYVILWSIMFALILWSGINDQNFLRFIEINKKLICIVTFILSLISLYKFYMLLQGVMLPLFNFNGTYAYGTALSSDMNMFALTMLIGLVVTLSLLRRANSILMKYFYLIPTITLIISIFMSGSRRGFILTTLVILIAGFIFLKKLLSNLSIVKVTISAYIITFVLLLTYIGSIFSGVKLWDKISELINENQFQYTISRFLTISPEQLGNTFSSRSGRWDYAFTLIKEYNPLNLLFGKGFEYIGEYRQLTSTFIEDYPHNFFVSALLYSGVFGTSIVVMLFIVTFYNILKNRHAIGLHMILIYLITFSYMFISGNSVFSYKFFIFITILINFLPFRRKAIQDKKESVNRKTIPVVNEKVKTT